MGIIEAGEGVTHMRAVGVNELAAHKKAEAIQKHGKRFTKDSLFSPSYISFS